MRVLITGATGLIGQKIVECCHEEGIKVNYLTTRTSQIQTDDAYKGFYWNPKTQEIDSQCFEHVDAIIHLAGATIVKRWTPRYRKEIVSSRVDTTRLLINALKRESHHIKQVISASAIGIYPDSQVNYYEESYKTFDASFLSSVVQRWEQAVDGFSELNINVSKIRIGLVLSDHGGALQKMVKPIRLGFGAAFGSGKQWQSWIHIEDLARLFIHILKNNLVGTYNGVAPNPVTHGELIKGIARQVGRPLILPNIPRIFMKLLLGDMHTLLFESQRVSSKKIENKGFEFKYNNLIPALDDLL
ncbi:TIGR01777 family oxidoreductase [Aestuariivivens sediminis]|uniref:TIGR01777 family oxidoreductase n=1 Tax=Aestuariivivens sediminis TaxID=2913557 RepID=UPI001F566F1A|nr:TIGR01777 family oxidoreductase [Aestuariivivens sediminis]